MASTAVVFSPRLPPSSVTSRPNYDNKSQIQPDNRKFELLKSCTTLAEIKQLHCHFTKHGLIEDPAILTNLVVKYSQLSSYESLDDARKSLNLFKQNRESRSRYANSAYLYNSLIKGISSAGAFRDAILLYIDMSIDGVAPDSYTFPFVLSACAKGSMLSQLLELHAAIVKLGFHSDVFVLNSLVHCYGECGEIDKARKVFDEMPVRNVVSWTSLICGYAGRDRHGDAVSLFFQMLDEEIEPNEVTLVSAVSSCAKLGDLDLGMKVLDYLEKSGLKMNPFVVNALVDMYMKCGAEHTARRLFDDCYAKSLVLYNTVMSNYVKLGKVEDAINIFHEMLDVGMKPDRITILSVITSSAEIGNSYFGMQSHAYAIRNGLEKLDSVGNALIDMYSKCGCQEWACRVFNRIPNKTVVSWNSLLAGFARNGHVESARWTFEKMPERDLVSWNSMIGALVQHSLFRDAIELFHSMQNERIMADEVTMVSIASACGYLGALDLAKWIHNYIDKYGIHCNIRLSTALIDMFGRCGDPQSAMKIFGTMEAKDVSAWTAAIGAMAISGNGERAVELFNEMIEEGIAPDEVVFSTVLTACSRAGLVKQGMDIFNKMQEHGIAPHIIHYGCIVDLLGRAGFLDEALNFIYSMAMEPNSAIWTAFLSACRVHKNEKMANHAAAMVEKSNRAGMHVLLSNVYASAGKWDEVAKVRMQMRQQGMKKTPGSSSIEVNGIVHEFTSGIESHPQMLDEINLRLRNIGYAPDLSNVVVDINEQEKEFVLARHSEKVAIAFGLVSTSKGTAVRVVKNLRMCSDCHTFAKMVSKVYDREIIVRDNNRFHFFREGGCSCNDFW